MDDYDTRRGAAYKMGDLGIVFVTFREGAEPWQHCTDCLEPAEFLCDFPVGDGKTCDRPLCEGHAHEVAPDVHYCTGHHAMWEEFRASGGVVRELAEVIPWPKKR